MPPKTMLFSPHTRRCLSAFYEGFWEGLAAPYYLFKLLRSAPACLAAPVDSEALPIDKGQTCKSDDWQRIGSDLWKVISQYESTLQQKAPASATKPRPEK